MVQCLNERLIKTLGSVKEQQVNILGITVNKKPLLEVLRVNKDAGMLEIDTGYTEWCVAEDTPESTSTRVAGGQCLSVSFNGTVCRFLDKPLINSCATININSFSATQEYSIHGIELDAKELLKALLHARSCVAKENSRPILTCVLWECSNDKITLVSADGFRLPVIPVDAEGISTSSFLTNTEDTDRIIKLLRGNKTVAVDIQEDTLVFQTKLLSLTCTKEPGTFPEYSKFIPDSFQHTVLFNAYELLNRLKGINKDTRIIRLECSNNWIKVSAEVGEEDDPVITGCDASTFGDCRIALDRQYLINLLKHVGKKLCTLQLNSSNEPMKFTWGNSLCLIMPIQADWNR